MAERLILLADDADLWGPSLKSLIAAVPRFGWAVVPYRNQPGNLGVRSLCLNMAYVGKMKQAQDLASGLNGEPS